MRTREEIVADMALALTVTSVADGIDNGVIVDKDLDPGPGGEWFDTVTETDPEALKACEKLADAVEEATGMTLRFCEHLWKPYSCRPDDFGYLLVMQSLSHGVGLSDDFIDHKRAKVELKGMLSDLNNVSCHFSYFDLSTKGPYEFTTEESD
jgi:hypothetical protein